QSTSPGGTLKKLIGTYQQEQADVAILFEEVDPQSVVKYGIAKPAKPKGKIDTIFEIADLIEKPTVAEAPSNLAIAARYVFSPEIFEFIKKTEPGRNNEIQITDSIRLMLAQGGHGFGIRLDSGEKRYDIGNYKSYFEAFFRFSLADPEFGQDFGRYAKTHL
ncbi:MAG: sugar phosphate nucleotidyltransferase, partial [Candidatus Poribacteria bacterium]|nr:sugar phosphate nucleotidyltransferase [Candidatus Poribacteria bacterium]